MKQLNGAWNALPAAAFGAVLCLVISYAVAYSPASSVGGPAPVCSEFPSVDPSQVVSLQVHNSSMGGSNGTQFVFHGQYLDFQYTYLSPVNGLPTSKNLTIEAFNGSFVGVIITAYAPHSDCDLNSFLYPTAGGEVGMGWIGTDWIELLSWNPS